MSKADVAVKDQEIAAKSQEFSRLTSQLTAAQQDAGYWTQLSSIFMPVDLKSMTDHKAFMTPDGLVLALDTARLKYLLEKELDLGYPFLSNICRLTIEQHERQIEHYIE